MKIRFVEADPFLQRRLKMYAAIAAAADKLDATIAQQGLKATAYHIKRGNTEIGLASYYKSEGCMFIVYFEIRPDLRSQGLGRKVIEWIKTENCRIKLIIKK